jgi:homocysteine S-methyltransferase
VKPNPFGRFLDAQAFAVLDGGLAAALEAGGYSLDTTLWCAQALLDAPRSLLDVHTAYLRAGADCLTSAGYQASFEAFEAAGLGRRRAGEALRRAVELALEAKESFWSDPANRGGRLRPIVAASAGPYGAFLADGSEYDGRYGVRRTVLERFHSDRLDVLADAGADVIAFETVPSLLEAEVIAGLLEARRDTPAWISFSCRDASALWDGSRITDAVSACASVPALAAIGVNCTAPRHVADLVGGIRTRTDLPIVVYPNSGERYDPDARIWKEAVSPWVEHVDGWIAAGARVIGGCCRTGPQETRQLRLRMERFSPRLGEGAEPGGALTRPR